jgi:hypothetical protein
MKVPRLLLSLLMTASVLVMSACANPFSDLLGGDKNPNSPSSSTPTTDTFSGALAPNGSVAFTFSVATTGNVAITLTAVSPAATGPLGLGVGPSSNGNCTITSSTSGAMAAGSPQLSAAQNAGSYCVRVTDAGSLTTSSTVTVTVTHP